MLTTFLVLVILILSTIGSLLLSAWLLRLGARWARVGPVSYRRAVVAVLLSSVAGTLVLACVPAAPGYPLASSLVGSLLALVATWAVVQSLLRTSCGKAILAWLPTL